MNSISINKQDANRFLNDVADGIRIVDDKYNLEGTKDGKVTRTEFANARAFTTAKLENIDSRISIGNQIKAYVQNSAGLNPTLKLLVGMIVDQVMDRLQEDKDKYSGYASIASQIASNDLYFAASGDLNAIDLGSTGDLAALEQRFGLNDDGNIVASSSETLGFYADIATNQGVDLVDLLNSSDIRQLINGDDDADVDGNDGNGDGLTHTELKSLVQTLRNDIASSDDDTEISEKTALVALLTPIAEDVNAFIKVARTNGGQLRISTEDIIQSFSNGSNITAGGITGALASINGASYTEVRDKVQELLDDNTLPYSFSKADITSKLVDADGNSLLVKEVNAHVAEFKAVLDSPNFSQAVKDAAAADLANAINESVQKYAALQLLADYFDAIDELTTPSDQDPNGRITINNIMDDGTGKVKVA
ncbi:MAG: hypothetical protein KC462_09975 [Cyanobacteria bacterium HKST-UBA05]|nr:hypothetical protein [Cyanobacteria bacterium HKST-UBA05]